MASELSLNEQLLREMIMAKVDRDFLTGGSFTRDQLMRVDIEDGTTRAVIDYSRGIRNPQDMAATLSIVSASHGPYGDEAMDGGLLRYDYRAGSVHGDNAKLRRAMELNAPMLLFLKPEKNQYIPISPVYVVEDHPDERYFLISVDPSARMLMQQPDATGPQRAYVDRLTRQRLHQPVFRGLVMRAYQVRCAVCRLRHGELLDAAHITPDSSESGDAVVPNGLSLCKIHHAAFDKDLLGITPDYKVRINHGLLLEEDGPMLLHGLQEMHGATLTIPARATDHPDRDRLALRYRDFVDAGG